MPGKTEQILINIAGLEVGISQTPETSEASDFDRLYALEFGLHALNHHCVERRLEAGMRVPAVMVELEEARTFEEFR